MDENLYQVEYAMCTGRWDGYTLNGQKIRRIKQFNALSDRDALIEALKLARTIQNEVLYENRLIIIKSIVLLTSSQEKIIRKPICWKEILALAEHKPNYRATYQMELKGLRYIEPFKIKEFNREFYAENDEAAYQMASNLEIPKEQYFTEADEELHSVTLEGLVKILKSNR